MEAELVLLSIFALFIIVGATVVLSGMWMRGKSLEMMHKERLAMIERGMVPPALADPEVRAYSHRRGVANRSLDGGIFMVGFGLALGFIIGFAGGAPEIATGIGGAIVILGSAFIVRAMVSTRQHHGAPPPPAPPVPPGAFPTFSSSDEQPAPPPGTPEYRR